MSTSPHHQYVLVILKFPRSTSPRQQYTPVMLKSPLSTSPHQQYTFVILKSPLSKYTSSRPWPYLAAIYTSQMRSDHRRRLRSICQTGYAPACPQTTGCCHTPHIALTSSCWRPEKKHQKNTHCTISNVYFFGTPQPTPSVSNNNAHTPK